MFPVVALGLMVLTCCHCSDVFVSVLMEKMLSFENSLPQTSDCYINNVDNTSPAQCVSFCLTRREVCKGVVFIRGHRTCKLLQCKPNEYLTVEEYVTGKWDLYWKPNGVCKQGWVKHEGHCYFLNRTVDTWLNAKCSPWWVCCDYWTGGNSIAVEGTFVWASDNSTLGFSNWYPGEPDNAKSGTRDQDCVTICRDGHWIDTYCDNYYAYICKVPTI